MGRRGRATAILLALAAGCIEDPVPKQNGGTLDAGAVRFADGVLAFTDETGAVQSCGAGLGCPPAAACASHPALGAPDGVTYELRAGSRLEIGLLCGFILDRPGGAPTPDFKVWSTVPDGARAVVSVSLEGSEYAVVDYLDANDDQLDLDRARLEVARFVRIVHEAGPPILIDAVEAL